MSWGYSPLYLTRLKTASKSLLCAALPHFSGMNSISCEWVLSPIQSNVTISSWASSLSFRPKHKQGIIRYDRLFTSQKCITFPLMVVNIFSPKLLTYDQIKGLPMWAKETNLTGSSKLWNPDIWMTHRCWFWQSWGWQERLDMILGWSSHVRHPKNCWRHGEICSTIPTHETCKIVIHPSGMWTKMTPATKRWK